MAQRRCAITLIYILFFSRYYSKNSLNGLGHPQISSSMIILKFVWGQLIEPIQE